MKKIILIFLLILTSCQYIKAQWTIGFDNTRYAYGKYSYRSHYTAKLNISLFSEKIGFQYYRGTLGYTNKLKNLTYGGSVFYGSTFNHSFYNLGANIETKLVLFRRLLLIGELSPWFDSGYQYNTCFYGGIGCVITKHIDFTIGHSTIPEYRMAEKRIIGGLDFHVDNMFVKPYISFSNTSRNGGKNVRILFDFGYRF